MATKKDNSASFMVRFNQKIYKDDKGENQVQWRGSISHVQGGDERRFTQADDAIAFIQEKLNEMTMLSVQDHTEDVQEGLLSKSLNIWKKVTNEGPKLVLDTIKDPKKGVAQIQHQIQDQISQVKEEIGSRVDIDSWMVSSKEDYKNIMQKLNTLTDVVHDLNQKVDALSKKKK